MRRLPPPELTPKDIDLFWSKVVKTDGCWERGKSPRSPEPGYPSILISGVSYRASAISFMIHHGRYPELLVCHTCDNKRCVRPDHLFEGTNKDNSMDMMAKGRGVHRGLKLPRKKEMIPVPSGLHLIEEIIKKKRIKTFRVSACDT